MNYLQGSYFPDKRLAVRIVAAVWCLTACVLVNSYNSVLISYVTSPNAEPLIRSIKDLGNSSIHIVVDAYEGIDIVLMVNIGSMRFKYKLIDCF